MSIVNIFGKEEYFVSGHSACAGCGSALAMRHITKAAGKNTIIVCATGCMEVVSTSYPLTSWKLPWIHGAFDNVSSIASGVSEALEYLNKKTNVIVIGGDGALFDIGFAALSGALERMHNVLHICYDNEAYENTGIQRSGATPRYANTTTSPAGKIVHGKTENKKPLTFIVAAHKIPYVATANISNIQDMYNKIKKALTIKGPKYIEILCPCPVGWYFNTEKTIEIARLAIKTRIQPLYEIENGKLTINVDVNEPLPVIEYLKLQGRFKHLTNEEINKIQQYIDNEWARLKRLEKSDSIF